MNIKSDAHNNHISKLTTKCSNYILKRSLFTWLVIIATYWASVSIWSYSGIISFFLFGTASIIFKEELSSHTDWDNVGFVMILLLILSVLSANQNVYDVETVRKELVIESYEFIDSTEKIVIKVVKPFKRTIVLDNVPSEKFFTLRFNDGDDMTGAIMKKQSYDHIDKLLFGSEASIKQHNLQITLGGVTHIQPNFCMKRFPNGKCDDKLI